MDVRSPSTHLPALLAVVVALALSTGAAAQPTVSVQGNVGASFFRSPDFASETLHSGVDLGLGVDVRVYRGLSITARGGYDQFTLDEERVRAASQGIQVTRGDISFLNGSLGVRYTYRTDSDAHPYASMGIGGYQLRSSDRRVFQNGQLVNRAEDATETKMGGHVAVGSLFRLDDTYAVFFEPRYVFYDLSESIGGEFRYFTLRLGIDVRLN
jgi:opacity protein-like surface antigen